MEQNLLKNVSLKATKKRKLLLFLLHKQQQPMTAEFLFEQAQPYLPMNLSTVYRTLNALTEKGILIRSIRQDGKAYFALPQKNHHHQLICTFCGSTAPVAFCPLEELEEALAQETGYQITNHTLSFMGICPQCQDGAK